MPRLCAVSRRVGRVGGLPYASVTYIWLYYRHYVNAADYKAREGREKVLQIVDIQDTRSYTRRMYLGYVKKINAKTGHGAADAVAQFAG